MRHLEHRGFSYDFRNRLTNVEVGGTVVATYVYDALNRRIGIDDNGTQTWTVYDGTNAYADFNGSGTLKDRYLYGPAVDELLARTSSGGDTAWYISDKDGSVQVIYDASAGVVDTIVYDSFGQVVTETGASYGDRFKYAGMEYDSAIQIYYDQARNYNPATGRFLQQDPLGLAAGDVNVYRYVFNEPTNLVDPSGLRPAYVDGSGNVSSPPLSSAGPSNPSSDDCCCCCCSDTSDLPPSSEPPGGFENPIAAGAVGLVKGTVQGALNTANGLTDTAIDLTINSTINELNILAILMTGKAKIPRVNWDWSFGKVTDEGQLSHKASKIAGSFGIQILATLGLGACSRPKEPQQKRQSRRERRQRRQQRQRRHALRDRKHLRRRGRQPTTL